MCLQDKIYKLIISDLGNQKVINDFRELKDKSIELSRKRKLINKDFYYVRNDKKKKDEYIFMKYINKVYSEKNYTTEISNQYKEFCEKKFK